MTKLNRYNLAQNVSKIQIELGSLNSYIWYWLLKCSITIHFIKRRNKLLKLCWLQEHFCALFDIFVSDYLLIKAMVIISFYAIQPNCNLLKEYFWTGVQKNSSRKSTWPVTKLGSTVWAKTSFVRYLHCLVSFWFESKEMEPWSSG